MAPHVSCQTSPRYPPDLGADHLNGAHQRVGQQQRPAEGVAELRARLRIGGDAAWIVVRSSGDKSWPHDIGQLRSFRLLILVFLPRCLVHRLPFHVRTHEKIDCRTIGSSSPCGDDRTCGPLQSQRDCLGGRAKALCSGSSVPQPPTQFCVLCGVAVSREIQKCAVYKAFWGTYRGVLH